MFNFRLRFIVIFFSILIFLSSCTPKPQCVQNINMQACSDSSKNAALKECQAWEKKLLKRHGKKFISSACNVWEGGLFTSCEYKVFGSAQIQLAECVETASINSK